MRKDQLESLKKEIYVHVMTELNKSFHMVPRMTAITSGTVEEYLGAAVKFICSTHGISFEEMCSSARRQRIVYPRQLYCYITRRYFGNKISFEKISLFIHQDHATVMHAVKRIQNLIDVDRHTREHVDIIYQGFHDTIKELEFNAQLDKLDKLKQTA